MEVILLFRFFLFHLKTFIYKCKVRPVFAHAYADSTYLKQERFILEQIEADQISFMNGDKLLFCVKGLS